MLNKEAEKLPASIPQQSWGKTEKRMEKIPQVFTCEPWEELPSYCQSTQQNVAPSQDSIVVTRMAWTIFRIGDPKLNLHFQLLLGGGHTQSPPNKNEKSSFHQTSFPIWTPPWHRVRSNVDEGVNVRNRNSALGLVAVDMLTLRND